MGATPNTPAPNYDFVYAVPTPQGFAHTECYCVTMDAWTHLAFVVDGTAGTLTTYVNGAFEDVVAVPAAISPGQTSLLMGRWPGPVFGQSLRYLTGSLDDIAIWTRALVAEEVQMLFLAPAPTVP